MDRMVRAIITCGFGICTSLQGFHWDYIGHGRVGREKRGALPPHCLLPPLPAGDHPGPHRGQTHRFPRSESQTSPRSTGPNHTSRSTAHLDFSLTCAHCTIQVLRFGQGCGRVVFPLPKANERGKLKASHIKLFTTEFIIKQPGATKRDQ